MADPCCNHSRANSKKLEMGFAFKYQALLSEELNIVYFDEHYSRTESFVRSHKPAGLGGCKVCEQALPRHPLAGEGGGGGGGGGRGV